MAKKEKETKTNAMRILDSLQISYSSREYECDEFTSGKETADKLGLPHEEVFKTLTTIGKSGQYYVFVIPIDEEIDLKKAAKAAGEKSIEMLPLKELTKITGYVRGGCTSIGMKKAFPTFVQEDAMLHEQIYVSAGKLGMQLALSPDDLIKANQGSYADIIRSE